MAKNVELLSVTTPHDILHPRTVSDMVNVSDTKNLTQKLSELDAEFKKYLPLTGGTLTGLLNANGGINVNGNAVWHSGNFDPNNKRDNLSPASGNWHRGTPIIDGNGIMEIGKIIDFHAGNNDTKDYDVRVESLGGESLAITGSLIPSQNNGFSVGIAGNRWSTGEFETTFTSRVDTRGGDLKLRAQGGGAYVEVESTIRPHNDGGVYLGSSTRRWNSVWSSNGTIQTSDERYKGDIQDIDDEQFFDMVKGVSVNTYVMLNERKDKITRSSLEQPENKQSTASSERVQCGIIAQEMAQFDCGKYILVHDEETDIYSINNYNFTSAIMGALKVEIQKREELEDLVLELKKEVDTLKAKVA